MEIVLIIYTRTSAPGEIWRQQFSARWRCATPRGRRRG